MDMTVQGIKTYAATGGVDLDPALPTVLFIPGSGLDHRSWALQTRWFAYHGFSVLAPDFPGHSLSDGTALETIEEMGEWLNDLLGAADVDQVHVVGHSQGYLAGLEFARKYSEKVLSIVGIGTAATIPVNPALIGTAEKSSEAAAGMMLQWGFGDSMHIGVSPIPGMQPIGQGMRIMSSNPLATDLKACAAYVNGEAAAKTLSVPCLFILAENDRMTPIKNGLGLAKMIDAEVKVLKRFGHMLPIEAPRQCLNELKQFIVSVAK